MSKTSISIEAIEKMKKNNSLDEATYSKCLVEICYSALKDGDFDGAVRSISGVKPEYFNTDCLAHMEEDLTYKEIVIYLSYKFIQLGMVSVNDDIRPTQNMGVA